MAQDGFKMGPKRPQDSPKMAPRCLKMPQDTHLGPKDVDISKNIRFPKVFARFL